jgi:uncharacterized protein DUF998
MSDMVIGGSATKAVDCTPGSRVTKSLLGYGALAGPFYVVVVLLQALLRPGFNLAHDDASLLSNGDWGWVQIANFVLTGAMVIACAVGFGRALRGQRGGTWAPRLLALYGLGLVVAGIFVADPMNGFPAGAPAGRPVAMTAHGTLHVAAAALGFVGLIATCFVLASRYAADHRTRWAWFSRASGILFLLAFIGVASGSGSAGVVMAFWAALLVAWGWLAGVAIDLYRAV